MKGVTRVLIFTKDVVKVRCEHCDQAAGEVEERKRTAISCFINTSKIKGGWKIIILIYFKSGYSYFVGSEATSMKSLINTVFDPPYNAPHNFFHSKLINNDVCMHDP